VELAVEAALGQQLDVAPDLHEAPVLDDGDLVGTLDRGQAMGDGQAPPFSA